MSLTTALTRGYPTLYAVLIEGIPWVFTERDALRVTSSSAPGVPAGYDSAVPALAIRQGDSVAIKLDRQAGVADGRSWQMVLGWDALDDAELRDVLFRRAEGDAWLTADVDGTSTQWDLDDTTDLTGSTRLYVGRECVAVDDIDPDAITIGTRGVAGWPGAYQAGSLSSWRAVATHPQNWRGRIVRLYECAASPDGRLLDDVWTEGDCTELLWSGYIEAPPKAIARGMAFDVLPIVRLATQPVGYEAALEVLGSGVISRSAWPIVSTEGAQVTVTIEWEELSYGEIQDSGTITVTGPATSPGDADVLETYGEWVERLRAEIQAAVDADAPWAGFFGLGSNGAVVLSPTWGERFAAQIPGEFQASLNQTFVVTLTASVPDAVYWWASGEHIAEKPGDVPGLLLEVPAGPGLSPTTWLAVRSEDEAVEVPTASLGILDVDGAVEIVQWTDTMTGTDAFGSPLTVLHLTGRGLSQTKQLEATAAGAKVRSVSGITGPVAECILTVLQSSGTGLRGDYDTLGLGLGYGIPEELMDPDTFTGEWAVASSDADLVTSGRASLEEMAGGWLALTGRCISQTSGRLVVVPTLPALDPAAPVLTAEDILLDVLEPMEPAEAPTDLVIQTSSTLDEQAPTVKVNDLPRIQGEGARTWDLAVPGIDPGLAHDLGKSLIGLGDGLQVARVQTPAWVRLDPGDAVQLETAHPVIYDWSTGTRAPGSVACRVVEVETDLWTGTHRVALLLAGPGAEIPHLCPSATVTAVSGSDVTLSPGEGVFWRSGDEAVLYTPGDEDVQRQAVTVTTVTGDVLTLSATPPAWLAAGDRVTYPDLLDATAFQAHFAFAHKSTRWR